MNNMGSLNAQAGTPLFLTLTLKLPPHFHRVEELLRLKSTDILAVANSRNIIRLASILGFLACNTLQSVRGFPPSTAIGNDSTFQF